MSHSPNRLRVGLYKNAPLYSKNSDSNNGIMSDSHMCLECSSLSSSSSLA